MNFKRFDVDAELQNLRSTPPKAPKPPKVEDQISHFSHFRWGNPSEMQNPPEEARPFLPRPAEREEASDPWDAWALLFDWLREYHPDRFFAVCEAEESIRALEQQGIAEGPEYEQACAELFWRFEEARRLKLKESVKVWMQ